MIGWFVLCSTGRLCGTVRGGPKKVQSHESKVNNFIGLTSFLVRIGQTWVSRGGSQPLLLVVLQWPVGRVVLVGRLQVPGFPLFFFLLFELLLELLDFLAEKRGVLAFHLLLRTRWEERKKIDLVLERATEFSRLFWFFKGEKSLYWHYLLIVFIYVWKEYMGAS